ncbi:hypothetical protein C0992_005965 [Termitomyces sp. T32_za158]|nr:hypothetical protein C0992_005965 [Termitomyces sp. T32_za158]
MAQSPRPSSLLQTETTSTSQWTVNQYNNEADLNPVLERVWRKIDFIILPIVTMFQVLSFLDRTSLANARVAGLQEDLKLSEYQYTIVLTVSSLPSIAVELPMNLALRVRAYQSPLNATHMAWWKAVGPNRILPAMLTLWGVVVVFQGSEMSTDLPGVPPFTRDELGLVKCYMELLVCRFFLGLFEGTRTIHVLSCLNRPSGGVFSGLIIYLSFWYPRRHLQSRSVHLLWKSYIPLTGRANRVTTFLVIATLTGAFSGLLAYAIIGMDGLGNRPGWAWIFILEGIFSILFGISAFFTLPQSPSHARFLTKVEKEYVISRLRQTGAISRDDNADAFSWQEVRKAFTLPQVGLVSVIQFFIGSEQYSPMSASTYMLWS